MTVKVDSKEVGLVAGLNLFNFFLGTRDLHYGLWQEDLEVCIQNLPEAQRRYSDFLIDHIPEGVKRILDVGCGAGGVARELLARGYQVEGVSPSPLLSDAAQQQAGEGFKIHQGRFEDIGFAPDDKFDLVLFSESFQYISLDSVFDNAMRRLNPGGHVLICDFFKTGAPGRSVVGGGHPIDRFMETIEKSGLEVLVEPHPGGDLDHAAQHVERDAVDPGVARIGQERERRRLARPVLPDPHLRPAWHGGHRLLGPGREARPLRGPGRTGPGGIGPDR